MPYVPLAPAIGQAQLATATARWDALLSARPDLQPAIALQRRLLGLLADLAVALSRGRMPRLSLPRKYLCTKILRGVPVLVGESIPVPVAVLAPTLGLVCGALARGGAGDAADHIRLQLDETRMDAGSLLQASLKRDQEAIRTGALHRGLSPDLLWMVAELAVSPFVHLLEQALFAAADPGSPLRAALDGWEHGYCPLCRSWPALAEVVEARRVLRCSFCSLAWEPSRQGCVYCGERGDGFAVTSPNGDHQDQRIEGCATCGAYLKSVDLPTLSPFPLLALSDLETMALDLAAVERGYGRPPLKELGTQR